MLCLKAHAKINWTLDILGTREDGYHLMDMLMQSVDMHDTLWLEEADTLILEDAAKVQHAKTDQSSDELSSAAVTYDQSNLVYRAAQKLRDYCHVKKGARMRLLKNIPSGAGMGGGSADAAAVLRGLVLLWNLDISEDELLRLGLSLGADIPFMLTGGLARVGGIGEKIVPLSPAPAIHLVMLQPCGGLSTKEVFGAFDALDPTTLARPQTDRAQNALLTHDLSSLGKSMNNVLEGVSVQTRPAIGEAAKALKKLGAVHGMMTGSGSVVYGVFTDKDAAENACEKLRPIAQRNGWGDVWTTHTLEA